MKGLRYLIDITVKNLLITKHNPQKQLNRRKPFPGLFNNLHIILENIELL